MYAPVLFLFLAAAKYGFYVPNVLRILCIVYANFTSTPPPNVTGPITFAVTISCKSWLRWRWNIRADFTNRCGPFGSLFGFIRKDHGWRSGLAPHPRPPPTFLPQPSPQPTPPSTRSICSTFLTGQVQAGQHLLYARREPVGVRWGLWRGYRYENSLSLKVRRRATLIRVLWNRPSPAPTT